MGIEIRGFDELEKELKKIAKKAENLNGEVPFDILFNEDFMKKYSKFTSIDEMLEKSGFEIKNQDDFRKIPEAEWDEFVMGNTKFKNWEEMMNKAGVLYFEKGLGL